LVYANGSREVRARNLTLGAAQAIEATLNQAGEFMKVLLESDPERPGDAGG
jgi:hypothetical protein